MRTARGRIQAPFSCALAPLLTSHAPLCGNGGLCLPRLPLLPLFISPPEVLSGCFCDNLDRPHGNRVTRRPPGARVVTAAGDLGAAGLMEQGALLSGQSRGVERDGKELRQPCRAPRSDPFVGPSPSPDPSSASLLAAARLFPGTQSFLWVPVAPQATDPGPGVSKELRC